MRSQGGSSLRAKSVAVGSVRQRRGRSRWRGLPWSLVILPLIVWFGVREIRLHFEQPDAILVLGGSTEREKFSVEMAQQHPDLPVWISSGAPREYTESVFAEAGINLDRLHLDYQAVDTVTNFTTLADSLRERGIKSVYLVTSDYHMRRARVIGEIVFGSRGIDIKPITIPTGREEEPLSKAVRDGGRAILWVTTGRTGSTLIHWKERN